MTENNNYSKTVERIIENDPRYKRDAYFFLNEVVIHAGNNNDFVNSSYSRHVSGQELLEIFRKYALEQFGPLALEVLNDWGLHSTEDVGEVVFNMIENKLLGARKQDSRDDFANGYDFRQAFITPFCYDKTEQRNRPKIA